MKVKNENIGLFVIKIMQSREHYNPDKKEYCVVDLLRKF